MQAVILLFLSFSTLAYKLFHDFNGMFKVDKVHLIIGFHKGNIKIVSIFLTAFSLFECSG